MKNLLLLRLNDNALRSMKSFVDICEACNGKLVDPGHILMGMIVKAIEHKCLILDIKPKK